ncbi:Probable 3-phenylpropionic acid transporter [Morganella morganii]|nr:Probable 3-phenylpropionic acid transporter [Morganella morganii]
MLIAAQILHSGTYTVCHLAAMRFIGARKSTEIIPLQAAYSALAMGGAIAVMTLVAGYLYEDIHGGIFYSDGTDSTSGTVPAPESPAADPGKRIIKKGYDESHNPFFTSGGTESAFQRLSQLITPVLPAVRGPHAGCPQRCYRCRYNGGYR